MEKIRGKPGKRRLKKPQGHSGDGSQGAEEELPKKTGYTVSSSMSWEERTKNGTPKAEGMSSRSQNDLLNQMMASCNVKMASHYFCQVLSGDCLNMSPPIISGL